MPPRATSRRLLSGYLNYRAKINYRNAHRGCTPGRRRPGTHPPRGIFVGVSKQSDSARRFARMPQISHLVPERSVFLSLFLSSFPSPRLPPAERRMQIARRERASLSRVLRFARDVSLVICAKVSRDNSRLTLVVRRPLFPVIPREENLYRRRCWQRDDGSED